MAWGSSPRIKLPADANHPRSPLSRLLSPLENARLGGPRLLYQRVQYASFILLIVLLLLHVWPLVPRTWLSKALISAHPGQNLAPSRLVWQSNPLAQGLIQQSLPFTREELATLNRTGIEVALRMATIEPTEAHQFSTYAYRGQNQTILHIRLEMWDLPLVSTWGFERSDLEHELGYSMTLWRPSVMPEPIEVSFCHPIWDLLCQVPNVVVENPQLGELMSATLHIWWRGRILTNIDFSMSPRLYAISPMAICHKALYGEPNYATVLEWREHHRLMGFDVVHWSSRSPRFGAIVDKMNRLTGGSDTFDWVPILNTSNSGAQVSPWYDGWRTMDQCYVTYRFMHEMIGIWDHDEFFAPADASLPWTKSTVESWRSQFLDPAVKIGSIVISFAWLDGNRFGHIPSKRLRAVDPKLSDTDLQHLAQIKINRDGYFRTGRPDIMQWFKTLHNTKWIRHVGIHQDADRDAQAEQIRNDTSFAIWHARTDVTYLDVNNFGPFPVTKTIVKHWLTLWEQWHRLLVAEK